jgi:uncharacterized protein (TIGR03066 family)
MRTNRVVGLVVVVAALAVAGCESSNKGKIEGTKWSSNAVTIHGQKLSSGKCELEFYKDGTMDLTATDPNGYRKVFTGRYSLSISDLVVITFNQEVAGMKTHTERVTITKGELTMIDSDGTKLVFSRLK